MKFGNDTKIGLATIIPGLLLLGALALFIAALFVYDGDVEKASVWSAAVAVAFFGLLTTVVRLAGSYIVKRPVPVVVTPPAVVTQVVEPPAPPAASAQTEGAIRHEQLASAIEPDPLDAPAFDEPPAERTDAAPEVVAQT